MTLKLTDEQQRIINHDYGPALVFAVAGAGKTTTMVQRIARLVSERVFAPESILATSFGRATVQDIRDSLNEYPNCQGVQVKTLHSLGNQIIRKSIAAGYHTNDWLNAGTEISPMVLVTRTLALARKDRVSYASELINFDREDFLKYVGIQKGNLCYADLDAASLPDAAKKVAKQAEPPVNLHWYLDLYRRFEELRRQMHVITYDDMLLWGWELLVKHDDILGEMRGRISTIMVDEFQDVNLAQAEILDMLSQQHRNYMAIGDDDQTIYEWRGANPSFILNFQSRYDAEIYLISDNFRSKASHIALANSLIRHNQQRYPKQLSLTQGFDGFTDIEFYNSDIDMAWQVTVTIDQLLQEGYALRDISILIRTYGQTPQIEFYLVEKRIPYKIVGNQPFYKRNEIETLLYYLKLAQIQRQQVSGKFPSIEQKKLFSEAWRRIYNTPTRYFNRDLMEKINKWVVVQRSPFCDALVRAASEERDDRNANRLFELAELIEWLAEQFDTLPAEQLLAHLDSVLDYRTYLQRSSGFVEIGEEKARNVSGLLNYAKNKGTAREFLEHIDYLDSVRIGSAEDKDALSIQTVFRAKGLEWPAVIVPGCNDGTFPMRNNPNSEEERRLFYVAMTRAKERLYLYALRGEPTSYLQETEYEQHLPRIDTIRNALSKPAEQWNTEELLTLVHSTQTGGLERYFREWWPKHTPVSVQTDLAEQALALLTAAEQRGLLKPLGLDEKASELWQRYGLLENEPDAGAFSDLETFLPKQTPEPEPDSPESGEIVVHGVFGRGRVLNRSIEGKHEVVTVDFKEVGVKRISAAYLDLLN